MRSLGVRWLLPLIGVGVLGVGAAMAATTAAHSSNGTVNITKSAKYGMVLVSSTGRTLYRFTPDSKNKNTCKGQCATYWPAYMAKGSAKPTAGTGTSSALIGTIKHGKGLQVTYGGFPLYTYVGDTKAGQMNGEGKDKTWYVVSTKGALVKKAVATTNATTTTPTTTAGGGSAWG
jgi:predicted lipoprotein with Yx(FWY)xxD motif